ncbi:hypothetical protein ACSVH2_13445 [Flavobacterium sp. RSB2_4_14]|uniref:hypothetical protein n=1 Tax=Flavobacterium sp. RSB2_4_14 TaxID=3447665 RepID=UPI003F3C1849
MKKRTLISFILTIVLGISSVYGQGCSGQFKTYTQGGYGTACNGNNPGCYTNANFAGAFPNGLVIGCGSNTLTFTSSLAIQNYLPAGGDSAILTSSAVNPTNSRGVLSSQLIALTLSVGFDAYDSNFSASSASLGSLTIKNGVFAGMSISSFLQLANNIIGGCSSQYSLSAINEVATALNENFDNGTIDNGFVNCNRGISIQVRVGVNPDLCESGNNLLNITVTGGVPGYVFKIYKDNVLTSVINSNEPYVYLSNLGLGSFSITVTDSQGNTASASW